jgi:hypothetical protein
MTEQELLSSVRSVVSEEFGQVRQQLNSIEREQTGMTASLRHVTNNVLDLKQKVQSIDDTLNGPKGLVATTGVLTWVQEHCTARLRADAEATSPGRLPAIKNAKDILADSIPPNRVQLERERTEQQREKTRRANIRLVMLLVGVALGGGGTAIGVTQLVDALSPTAQAAQP